MGRRLSTGHRDKDTSGAIVREMHTAAVAAALFWLRRRQWATRRDAQRASRVSSRWVHALLLRRGALGAADTAQRGSAAVPGAHACLCVRRDTVACSADPVYSCAR